MVRESSTESVWSARPPPTTLGVATSPFQSSSWKASIQSGLARSMRPCSPSNARLAGMAPAALIAAMEPYLPILCAFALAEREVRNPAQRERLIQRVKATLRSKNSWNGGTCQIDRCRSHNLRTALRCGTAFFTIQQGTRKRPFAEVAG
jgi:hypothetical protein